MNGADNSGNLPRIAVNTDPPDVLESDRRDSSHLLISAAHLRDSFLDFKDALSEPDGDVSSDDNSEHDLNGVERFFTLESGEPRESLNLKAAENDKHKPAASYDTEIYQLLEENCTNDANIEKFEGWLGQDVLLQGKIYLTKRYFLFYGNLPPSTDDVLLAAPLSKKSTNKIPVLGQASYTRHWFVLKGGTFAWYNSAGDIYFPLGIINLHSVVSVDTVLDAPEKFVIRCKDNKSYRFKADSRNTSHIWCKNLKREVFKAGNKNPKDVAIVRIPLENIIIAHDNSVLDMGRLLSILAIPKANDLSSVSPNSVEMPVTHYKFFFFGRGKESFLLADSLITMTNEFQNHRGVLLKLSQGDPVVEYQDSKFGPTKEAVLDSTPLSELEFHDDHADDSISRVKTQSISQYSPTSHGGEQLSKENSDEASSITSTLVSPVDMAAGQKHRMHHHFPSRAFSKLKILSGLTKKLHISTKSHKNEDVLTEEGKEDEIEDEEAGNSTRAETSESIIDDEASDNDEDADSDAEIASNYEPDGLKIKTHRKFFDYQSILLTPYNLAKRPIMATVSRSNSKGSADARAKSASGMRPTQSPSKHLSSGSANEANSEEDAEINNWFCNTFGLSMKTKLYAEYVCTISNPNQSSYWIGENTSWSGRLFISNKYLCFQRRHALSTRWRVVVPIKDITHVSDPSSNTDDITLEVAETAYDNLTFSFPNETVAKDFKETLECAFANYGQKYESTRKMSIDEADENRYLDYALRTARLATYEPTVSSRLRHIVPPMIFDPKCTQFKEAFMKKPIKKLKFAMLMIGSRGDVQPYIALSQGLMAEGHACLILSHKEFRPWVESFGIEFREIAGNPSELMELMISHGSISYGFVKDALAHFKGWIHDLMKTSWKAMKSTDADVLIESPSSMVGIHIAEALNLPYFRAFTMPWTQTKAYPQALVSSDQNRSGAYNALTYTMYDRLVWFCISSYVNKWRKKHLKLPVTNLDCLSQEDVPFLYCVSPTILTPPLDQFDWVHTCGYWNLRDVDTNKEKEIDPKVKEFISKASSINKKIVYIGFGSIIVSDPEAMTKTIIEATKKADVHCILARGWSSRSADKKDGKKKDKTPIHEDHIFEVGSIDHQWLFPRMDVCVHHGGSGTTGASLTAGKPTIIKPFFGDQFFYASRVEDLHVGINLKNLNTERLTEALMKCTTDSQMIRQASVVGQQISHEHGVDEAILAMYEELDYAHDVTVRRRNDTKNYAESGYLPDPFSILHHGPGLPKLHSNSDSWLSLPRLGRREEHRNNVKKYRQVDVSI